MKKVISIIMVVALCFSFYSCNKKVETDVWESAIYTNDTELGNGQKTAFIKVTAKEKSVTLTVHSDKNNLAEVLIEQGIAEGENGAYGLYIKKVNGIVADYDVNQCYWGINVNGEGATTGADDVAFENGSNYELIYTDINE